MNFETFNFPATLSSSIARLGYVELTPIQEKSIPLILEGRDILASSHTGSGKTGAFAIPLVAKLMASDHDTAIILTPTRELATQVMTMVRSLTSGHNTRMRTALLIGGDPMGKQLSDLRANPRIVVGTPGRVNDHLERRTLKLNNAKFLVLDETDRMLDMGFSVPLETIVKHLPKPRQTLMFSATISKQIEKLSQKYLDNYEFIKIGEDRAVAPNIKQENVNVTEHNKYSTLIQELDKRTGSILVFVKTKHSAQNLADKLVRDNHFASAIHGDLKQRQRDRVMKHFRDKTHRILVATDIAARGLDILHIEHVINYDPPQLSADYIHRIGRTARAGREGSSLNFISEKDRKKWREINSMLAGGEPKDLDMNPRSHRGDSNSRSRPGSFGRNGENRPRSFGGRPPARSHDSRRTEDGSRPPYERRDRSDSSRPPYERRERSDSSRPPYERRERSDGNRPTFDRRESADGNRPMLDRREAPDGNKPVSDRRARPDSSRPSWQRDKPRSYGGSGYSSESRPRTQEWRAPREADGQNAARPPYRGRSNPRFDGEQGSSRPPRPYAPFGAPRSRPPFGGSRSRPPFGSAQSKPRSRRVVVVPKANES